MPVVTLVLDNLKGKFIYNDGKVKELHNGMGVISIRQWHQYPNILPKELYLDDETKDNGDRFDTF